MNVIVKYFVRGLVIVVPVAVTVYVVYRTFIAIDSWVKAPFPGAGVLVTIALILLVGVLASNIVGRKVVSLMETVFTRAPLVKLVYASIKDLIEAFVGDKKRFNRPVFVRLGGDARAIGFVTREHLEFVGKPGFVAVYFPLSYSVAGNVLLFPAENVEAVDADASQMMAFLVSGGISGYPAASASAVVPL